MSFQVGITGGIGAGKTTITRIFQALEIPVYYADDRAKYLMTNNQDLKSNITEHFGTLAYQDEYLNNSFLAKTVFTDKEKLKLLNTLVHPAVMMDYMDWAESHQNAPYTLKEAALLFETGSYKTLDLVILIDAPEEVRINRVLLRDSFRTKKDIEQIMAKQFSDSKKRELADLIIKNGESDMVIPQVITIHEKIQKKVKGI